MIGEKRQLFPDTSLTSSLGLLVVWSLVSVAWLCGLCLVTLCRCSKVSFVACGRVLRAHGSCTRIIISNRNTYNANVARQISSRGAPFFCGVRGRWQALSRRTFIVGALAKRSRAAGAHARRWTDPFFSVTFFGRPCVLTFLAALAAGNSLTFSRASPLMFWQAGPCASSVTMSETAHSPWIPDQVASGVLPGSSPVCFGPVSNRPESTGDKFALAGSVSSGACPLAPPRFCVWPPVFLLPRAPTECFMGRWCPRPPGQAPYEIEK